MSPEPSHRPQLRSTSRRTAVILGAIAAIGVLTAGAVNAHWDRGWHRGQRGGVDGPARFARFCSNDTERYHPVVRAFVKADLRLDQAQAAQFDELADLVLPGLEDLKRQVCNDFATRGGPAPERLGELAANLRRAADLAERAVAPTRQFYASLSDAQKQRVDELSQRRGRSDIPR